METELLWQWILVAAYVAGAGGVSRAEKCVSGTSLGSPTRDFTDWLYPRTSEYVRKKSQPPRESVSLLCR